MIQLKFSISRLCLCVSGFCFLIHAFTARSETKRAAPSPQSMASYKWINGRCWSTDGTASFEMVKDDNCPRQRVPGERSDSNVSSQRTVPKKYDTKKASKEANRKIPASDLAGCDPQDSLTGNSQGLAAVANVTAHELLEAITDPRGTGWLDSAGEENGDKCAWSFPASDGLSTFFDGSKWKLQMEWSNAAYTAGTGQANRSGQKGCIY